MTLDRLTSSIVPVSSYHLPSYRLCLFDDEMANDMAYETFITTVLARGGQRPKEVAFSSSDDVVQLGSAENISRTLCSNACSPRVLCNSSFIEQESCIPVMSTHRVQGFVVIARLSMTYGACAALLHRFTRNRILSGI